MECPRRRRTVSSRPGAGARPWAVLAVLGALASACNPARAVTVHADYFAFANNGSFIDGDADTPTARSRAVVDSGFVHQRIGIAGQVSDWIWQAKSSANLDSGTLRTYAFSDTTDSGADVEPPAAGAGWRSQAGANWADVVTFAAPANAPAAAAPVPITFRLDVRGNFAGFYATMTSTSYLMVNGKKSQVDFAWNGRLGPNGAVDATATTLGTVTGLSVDPGQLHGLLEVQVMVTPGTAIGVVGSASAKAAAGPYALATSDFDHTATLSIDAPAGYTFTSQSGVLLSVPEPSTWLAMLVGLALIAAFLRAQGASGRPALAKTLATKDPRAAASAPPIRRQALATVLAAGLAVPAVTAHAQASIEYTLIGHHVSTAGAVLTPIKHAAFALAPLPQADSVSLLLPGGHALTSVKYDTASGSTGWKADALALPGSGVFESEAMLSYHDAVLLGVTSAGVPPPGAVTVSITIDGTFSGSTSQGSTGFELNAFGLFTGAYLKRQADKSHPGMDLVSVLHDGVTTSFAVAAGVAFPFTQTLSLSAPVATLGAWSERPLPSIVLGNGVGNGGCTFINPCGVRLLPWVGPVLSTPAPIAFDVVDTLVHAGNGAGAPGESVIDQMNTARLSVQTPAGVYFALSSGALADDAAAMARYLDTPAVPEPASALMSLAGLAVLLARVLRRRRRALAGLLIAGVAAGAHAQPSFTTQAYFAGSLHTHTVDAASSIGAVYQERWEPPPPPPPGEPAPPALVDPGYRFDAEAHASGGLVAASPVFKLDATFRGAYLTFAKAPDIPFGSTPTAQARVSLHDSIVPTDPTLAPGEPMTFKLTFTLTGSIDPGPLCGGPCVALDFAHSLGGLTATAQTGGFYDFRGFGAGASLWEPELPGLNGVAQDFDLNFYAHIRANRDEALALGLLAHPGYYNSEGSIDFSHTVRLTGLSARDAQGADLPGFQLLSTDGVAYAAAVPEPAAGALWLAGLVLLAAAKAAKRSGRRASGRQPINLSASGG